MQGTIYNLDGDSVNTIELPLVFDTPYRPDLIKRAVVTAQANRQQPYGANRFAGLRTSAESFGSGRGLAHVPRSNGQGRRVPQTKGGRRAHPPKPTTEHTKKLNAKERRQAVQSAIAATTDVTRVIERGHQFDETLDLPIILTDEFESLEKTKAVVEVLSNIGVYDDIKRADDASIRTGRGKSRGRKYRRPTSILFVTGETPSKAARNLAGADVATGREVNAEDVAPGGHPGRLVIWTEHALEELATRYAQEVEQ